MADEETDVVTEEKNAENEDTANAAAGAQEKETAEKTADATETGKTPSAPHLPIKNGIRKHKDPMGATHVEAIKDGKIVSHSVTDSDGKPVSEITFDDNGNVTNKTIYDISGKNGTVLFYEGMEVSAVTYKDGKKTSYSYHDNDPDRPNITERFDSNGNIATVERSGYVSDIDPENIRDNYYSTQTFDANGNLLGRTDEYRDGSTRKVEMKDGQEIEHFYDKEGKEILDFNSAECTASKKFEEWAKDHSTTKERIENEGTQFETKRVDMLIDGRKVFQSSYNKDGALMATTKYDKDGNATVGEFYDKKGNITERTEYEPGDHIKSVTRFDSKGRKTESISFENGERRTDKFDKNGNISETTKEVKGKNGDEVSYSRTTLDGNGNVVSLEEKYADGSRREVTQKKGKEVEHFYNKDGKEITDKNKTECIAAKKFDERKQEMAEAESKEAVQQYADELKEITGVDWEFKDAEHSGLKINNLRIPETPEMVAKLEEQGIRFEHGLQGQNGENKILFINTDKPLHLTPEEKATRETAKQYAAELKEITGVDWEFKDAEHSGLKINNLRIPETPEMVDKLEEQGIRYEHGVQGENGENKILFIDTSKPLHLTPEEKEAKGKTGPETTNGKDSKEEDLPMLTDDPNALGGREGKQGELEEEMWRLAWKNKLLAFDHNKDDAEFPFVQCLPDTMKTISDDPKCVSMELKNGTKLLNSANGICMDHNGKPTIEDAMTMVRLGKEKGISKAKIDPNASPEFKKQTYIAMLAQGIEVANIEQLGFSKDQLAELNNEANKLKEKSANDLGHAKELDENYPKLGRENNVEKFEKFSKEDYQSLKDSLAQGKTGEKEQEPADKGTQEKEPQEKETQNEVLNDVTVERLDKETGITHLETFKNGKVVSDSTFDKDGKALEDKTWDESGKPLTEKTYAADGVNPAKEVVYDYDGEKLTGRVETEYNQDGTYKTTIYDAEGKVVPDKAKEQGPEDKGKEQKPEDKGKEQGPEDKGKKPQEQVAEPKASQKNAVQQMEDFQKEVSKEMNLTKDGKEGDYSAGQVEAGYNSISEDKKKNLSQKFGTIVLKFCEQYPEQAKKLAEDLKKPENASFAMKMKTLGNAFNSVKGQEVSGRTKAEKEDKKLRADILKSLQSDRAK